MSPMIVAVVLILAIHDGDTFRGEIEVWPGIFVRPLIRILAVDAPELHGKCPEESARALEAQKALAILLPPNSRATLTGVKPDKFGGRVDASVATSEGVDVAGELLKQGLAHVYDGKGRRQPWCASASTS